ncbi:hypothetical protein [Kamptonema sp. UHCC 0994]|uniref:hypothetical protein n=1 Tax=Kamptonema sp. UHCC 0994 TaxID=3031329 RepID=UPI0023BAFBBF|nr:hypothetical protein [Kamptonema sp. UHCC 0994]MDF0556964.1 hypothetical protein [Kamptonema sp. UHCC 0994]
MANINDKWQDVPEELYKEWATIFYASQEGINLSASCPVCGQNTLHCYYDPIRKQEIVIDSRKYVARGGLWQWCSSCYCYVHASASVPEWWSCSLDIDHAKLRHDPDLLENTLQKMK